MCRPSSVGSQLGRKAVPHNDHRCPQARAPGRCPFVDSRRPKVCMLPLSCISNVLTRRMFVASAGMAQKLAFVVLSIFAPCHSNGIARTRSRRSKWKEKNSDSPSRCSKRARSHRDHQRHSQCSDTYSRERFRAWAVCSGHFCSRQRCATPRLCPPSW